MKKDIWFFFFQTYKKLYLLFVYEILLIFINCRLQVMKQTHNWFMGGLEIIVICEFYQTPLVWNSS
jgi:hypothetical protein